MRTQLSEKYINGYGIEIGALHNPLIVKNGNVKYVDRKNNEMLRLDYPELNDLELVYVDIVDDGETLSTIDNNILDFIICNHFIEHCQNPIGTIRNFLTKIKIGGIIYMAIPDKNFSFDIDRELTNLEHLRLDDMDSSISKKIHYEEWLRYVCKFNDDAIEEKLESFIETGYSIHFHVWNSQSFIEFLNYCIELKLTFNIKESIMNQTELICILEKI